MSLCEAGCRKQAWAGNESNIHKASFIERRLFYLMGYCVVIPFIVSNKGKLCYKGM